MKQYVFRTHRLSCGYLNLLNLFLTSYKNNYGKGICLNLYHRISKKGFSFTLERERKKGLKQRSSKILQIFFLPKK